MDNPGARWAQAPAAAAACLQTLPNSILEFIVRQVVIFDENRFCKVRGSGSLLCTSEDELEDNGRYRRATQLTQPSLKILMTITVGHVAIRGYMNVSCRSFRARCSGVCKTSRLQSATCVANRRCLRFSIAV